LAIVRASVVAILLTLFAAPARAVPPRTIPVSEIKVGMVGYGLTVFQGTRPEKFAVKVMGVLHNFLPKQDLILITSDDPRMIHSGVVAGMSGSPIFLETADGERLAGALSYGWHFAKDPIAGVTPIENMLAEARRPLRGKDHTPASEASLSPTENDRTFAAAERAPRPSYHGYPLPPALMDGDSPRLERAAVPLSVSGFGAAAFDELSKSFAPYHLIPLAAGGGAKKGDSDGPVKFEPGSSIAVELVRGDDMAVNGTGTVTWVDGDKVLAFGHPMFNIGEIYLPISTARIHTFMNAVSSSFKFSSPIAEAGTLVQDRQSCIIGDTGGRSDMIPVKVRVRSPGKTERVFSAEVVRHRFLTPLFTSTVIANATSEAASDVADATITLNTNIGVKGQQPLHLTENGFAPDGAQAKFFAASQGVKAVSDLLFNPFAPVHLDKIDVDVDVDYKPDVAEITDVSLRTDELEPGTRPSVQVALRPYAGPEYTVSIPVDIPNTLAGQLLKIEAAAGNLVKPDLAAPENVRGLLDNLRKGYPARSIVVTIETPDEDLTLRGSVVGDLPGSVADTLRPGASSRHGEVFKRNARILFPTRGVTVGKQSVQVRVKDLH
jgi:hypothetical protein